MCITCVCVWHNLQSCVLLLCMFGTTVSRLYHLYANVFGTTVSRVYRLCMCLAQPSVVCIACVCVWHNLQLCVLLVNVFGTTVSRVYHLYVYVFGTTVCHVYHLCMCLAQPSVVCITCECV